jgi:hypothetical protein
VLAVVWPLATVLTRPGPVAATVLVAGSVLLTAFSLPLWSHLRRSPADPGGVLLRSLDETVAERERLATAYQRRRTSYASDRRVPERRAPEREVSDD